jgi:hypothetical protein
MQQVSIAISFSLVAPTQSLTILDAVAQEAAAETQATKSSTGRPSASSRRIDEEEDVGGYDGEDVVDDDDYE